MFYNLSLNIKMAIKISSKIKKLRTTKIEKLENQFLTFYDKPTKEYRNWQILEKVTKY